MIFHESNDIIIIKFPMDIEKKIQEYILLNVIVYLYMILQNSIVQTKFFRQNLLAVFI